MRKTVYCAMGLIVMTAAGCGPKSRTAFVEFSYVVQPKTPLSEQHMQIAVRNANIECNDAEFDQKKWADMTADMVEFYLQEANEKHRVPIKLVDRENVKMAMEEKDLASAGVTDSGDAAGSAQIKGANAVVTSKLNIKIDKQKKKSKTITSFGAWGSGWGGGGGASADEAEAESRGITVACEFQLKDAATNEVVVPYSGKPFQHFNKAKRPSPFMGSDKTEADMEPRDQVIAQMIEQHVKLFLSKCVPTEIRATAAIKSGRSEASVEAVNALVVEDYDKALGLFKQILAEKSDDDSALFGAGICCEKLNRADEARKYYKQAQSLKPKDEQYAQAVDRVAGMRQGS